MNGYTDIENAQHIPGRGLCNPDGSRTTSEPLSKRGIYSKPMRDYIYFRRRLGYTPRAALLDVISTYCTAEDAHRRIMRSLSNQTKR
jgi:hypothetical protein